MRQTYVRCEYVTRLFTVSQATDQNCAYRTGAIFQKISPFRCATLKKKMVRYLPHAHFLDSIQPYVRCNMSCVSRQYLGCCTNAIIRLVIKLFIQCAYDQVQMLHGATAQRHSVGTCVFVAE